MSLRLSKMGSSVLQDTLDYLAKGGLNYELKGSKVFVAIPNLAQRDELITTFSDDQPWKIEVDSNQMPFPLDQVLFYGETDEAVEMLGLVRGDEQISLCFTQTDNYTPALLEERTRQEIREALERGRKATEAYWRTR